MGKLLSKITSGKSIASVAVAASAAIFVTAAVIIGIVFALIASETGLPSDMGTVRVGSDTTMDPPSSYPLSVVPDPVELWENYDPSEHTVTPTWNWNFVTPDPVTPDPVTGEPVEPVVSDDDGELHNGWNDAVSYRVREGRDAESGIKSSADYGMHVAVDFDVTYPQLLGDGEHIEEINEVLRDTALSFVNEYWEHPTKDAIERVKTSVEVSTLGVPEDADALLSSDVTWAVTYNNEDFISVSFSDSFCIGSFSGEYLRLRCVNANLKTGEVYTFDDVMRMDETIAARFVDTLLVNAGEDDNGDGQVTEDECFSVSIIGRQAWIDALMGRGDYAHRVVPTFFVDEKGRVNLGVSYWLGNDNGIVRGWWDAYLTDEELEDARKDSTFWTLWEAMKPESVETENVEAENVESENVETDG